MKLHSGKDSLNSIKGVTFVGIGNDRVSQLGRAIEKVFELREQKCTANWNFTQAPGSQTNYNSYYPG